MEVESSPQEMKDIQRPSSVYTYYLSFNQKSIFLKDNHYTSKNIEIYGTGDSFLIYAV